MFGRRGQKRFARFVSIPQSSLGKYEKGVSPNVDALRRIVEATEVNANWLLTGAGGMFADPAAGDGGERGQPPPGTIEYYGKVPGEQFVISEVEPRPLSGPVPASCCTPRYFALTLQGDTMEPELIDGDLLVFYRLPEAHARRAGWFERLQSIHGAIVLANHGGRAMVRRLMLEPLQEVMMLVSRSPRLLPLIARPARGGAGVPAEHVQLLGVLRNIVRPMADLTGASSDELDLDGRTL
ncbi:MAG: S24 family peptidase [Planctomycetota bacterium]